MKLDAIVCAILYGNPRNSRRTVWDIDETIDGNVVDVTMLTSFELAANK